MLTREDIKEARYGTPIYKITLGIGMNREFFQVNSFGHGMKELERYGIAVRVARNLVAAPVWHYTDGGNLVCGDGKNIETLPVREFTIVVDSNLDFLTEMMCPCGSDRLAAHKFFGIGITIAGLNPGELDGRKTPFNVILGDPR